MQSARRSFSWRDFFRFGKNKVEIVSETRRSLRIRRIRADAQSKCFYCEKESTFLSFGDAAVMFQTDAGFLEKFVEENKVHLVEFDSDKNLICLGSLVSKIDRK